MGETYTRRDFLKLAGEGGTGSILYGSDGILGKEVR